MALLDMDSLQGSRKEAGDRLDQCQLLDQLITRHNTSYVSCVGSRVIRAKLLCFIYTTPNGTQQHYIRQAQSWIGRTIAKRMRKLLIRQMIMIAVDIFINEYECD